MVTHILRYLSVSDRKDAALVNRTWYEASRDPTLLQDVVFLIPKNSSEPVEKAVERRNPHLVLETIGSENLILRNCERMCEGLQSLSVRGTDISEGMLITLLSRCESLESLDLSCCNSLFMAGMLLSKQRDVDTLRSSLVTLRELNLSSIRYLSDSTFNRIMLIAPNLRKLSLSGCQIMFHTRVYSGEAEDMACNNTAVLTFKSIAKYINSNARKIKVLDFGHTRINDSALESLAEMPELVLEEIYLDSCREISDEGISKLCKKQHSLQRISIAQCVDLGDASFHVIAAHVPNLKMLSFSKCRQITDSAVSKMAMMRCLKEINLSSCYNLTSPGLVKGLCTGPASSTLTHLNLNCCSGVNDSFIMELCQSTPGLLHLDIGSCFGVRDVSVHYISKSLGRLRFLRLAWCKEVTDFALLGLPNPDAPDDHLTRGGGNPPPVRRQPSKIFGDLASLLPDRPPAELSEEHVEILKSNHANQAGSIYPISHLRFLKVLDLTAMPQVTDASIRDAIKFNELQELHLAMCPGISDAALIAIGNNAPTTEVLNLSQCRRITDEGLIFVILRLRRLRFLNISSCDGITDTSMEALGAHAPHLKTLDVSLCSGISAKCVDKLEQSMKHLTCVKKRLLGAEF